MCIRDRSIKENQCCDARIRTLLKGTCSVKTLRRNSRRSKHPRSRVRIGKPDTTVTGLAGLAAVDELTERLCLAGMDRVRADPGIALLSEAPVAPSTTAGRLAGCFGRERLLGIEVGLAQI